ncbi:hypothetical protein SAMN05421878_1331 [Actinobaculum suis]|uniref:Uncharacterized protein n=1 Tax=Actinobaculum suis TaxID=1657 RepID=A0A1G7F040_9ACTO|nr:hypothetical protein [Actinobaculum suis]SDE69293.1 hypothetical protein SAMN05421878_1331 [Actinobaculum suis]VDG75666.1 Uncharacterised protein [Actinobaculum suis]
MRTDDATECSSQLTVKGDDVDYDMSIIGIDQIQAFENSASVLQAIVERENLSLDATIAE